MTAPIAIGGRAVAPAIAELAAIDRWVCWRACARQRTGKLTKRPFTPAGSPASSTNPASWSGFDEAWSGAFVNGGFDGIGFVLNDIDDLVAIDLDDAVALDGLRPWANSLVRALGSYTEVSPSCAHLGQRHLAQRRQQTRKRRSLHQQALRHHHRRDDRRPSHH
jgi:primase-polymerase (primpol)-like protein